VRGVAHFTDLKLYWEQWGGYPERDHPFGNPDLVWIVATRGAAARCRVVGVPAGAMEIRWEASWSSIPYPLVEPLPNLLEEIGAFGTLKPLVASGASGDYRVVHDITGVLDSRAFHFALNFTTPGHAWTPFGERLMRMLEAISGAAR
jgi:hypothetical protein